MFQIVDPVRFQKSAIYKGMYLIINDCLSLAPVLKDDCFYFFQKYIA